MPVPIEHPTIRESFCMSLDIRGALMNWKTRQFKKLLIRPDGSHMKPDEARAALLQKVSEGFDYLPIGDCDHFDPKHGCLGHPVPQQQEAAA